MPQPTEPLTTQDPLTNPDSDSNPTPTPSPEEDTTVEETPLPETLTAYLTEKGYIYTDAEGYRYAQSGRNTVYAELTLAYLSSDEERDAVAEMLVTLLKEEGVRLTLRPYESMAELKNGLYLSPAHMVYAELSLAPNLDLSTLLDPVTGLGADLQGSQALWQAYGRYLAGQLSGADMDALLQETAFFTPLYSRKGRMQYDRLFAEGVQTSPYCIYSGAETWYKYE